MPSDSDKPSLTHAAMSGAHPIRLIGLTYDLAVLSCERSDAQGAIRSIDLLREVMRSTGPEEVSDLLGMYDWCAGRIREGDFESARQTLDGLRESWRRAEDQFNSPRGLSPRG
jgi:hypothetical protein